jgi:hypothetical protein
MTSENAIRCLVPALVGAALGFWPGAARAQDGGVPEGRFYAIFEERPIPAMLEAYEATAKEFAAMVAAHRAEMPHYAFTTLQGEDLTYYYVTPVASHAGLDQINREYLHLSTAVGDPAFAENTRMARATTASSKQWMTFERAGFGYEPEHPRLKPEEIKFYAFEWFHLVSGGGGDEVGTLIKDWADLYRRKEIPDGFRTYFGVVGVDGPLLIVSVGARDAADYEVQQQKIRAALGADAEPLLRRTWAMTRAFEIKRATVRPELSIPAHRTC